MPCDERSRAALEALTAPREAFRSAVAQAVDEVRALLTRVRSEGAGAREQQALQLGAFAAGRIDVDRFSMQFARGAPAEPGALLVMEKSLAVLEEIASWSEAGFILRLDSGRDLSGAAGAALAMAGRAFGAARAIELARTQRFRADEHAALLDAFPPARWNRAERQIAPPLVVELDGGDLNAGDLAEFLDGTQKLVLVVGPPAPPAVLVRLITPGVLVAQIGDPAKLGALLAFAGPVLVALVPDTAARFVHDPAGGASLRERLSIEHLPEGAARRRPARLNAFQRDEELKQLAALAELTSAAAAGAVAVQPQVERAVAQPADRLAAWLLRQATITEP